MLQQWTRFASAAAAVAAVLPAGAGAVPDGSCPAAPTPDDTINVDVAIIGGGAAGSYAAAQLVNVEHKDIVLIETKDHLGGHVDTLNIRNPSAPGGFTPMDYGVLAYLNLPGAAEFFESYGVNITHDPPPGPVATTSYEIDFSTGWNVTRPPTDMDVTMAAIEKYMTICAKYVDYVYPYFNPPNPLVGDELELAIPFGEFLEKHDLWAIVDVLKGYHWQYYMLDTPTIFVMASQGLIALQGDFGDAPKGYIYTVSQNNSQLYGAIQEQLSDKLLLSSRVVSADRSVPGVVELVVDTPSGSKKVKAKKLLITAPPTIDNLSPFGLDSREEAVFGDWTWLNMYTGVLANSGVPEDGPIWNVSPNGTRAYLPEPPYVVWLGAKGAGLVGFITIGDKDFRSDGAKGLVVDSLTKIHKSNTIPANTDPAFLGFADHSPAIFITTPEKIRCGFFSRLNALQGYRDTYYAGASWTGDYSSIIWTHTGLVVKQLVE